MMNVLVTGTGGFVGKNLVCALERLRDGKDRSRPGLRIDEVFKFNTTDDSALLKNFCGRADFVFYLAEEDCREDSAGFMEGSCGFSEILVKMLEDCGNTCPVALVSVRADARGRYKDGKCGEAELAAEKTVLKHAADTGAGVLLCRLPVLFGKWCRPGCGNIVADLCYSIARGLPLGIEEENTQLELLYIDDLIDELLSVPEGKEHSREGFLVITKTYRETLGRIVSLLKEFNARQDTLIIPEMPEGSLEKKLCSTFVSYLPKDRIARPLKTNADERGSFTELLKTDVCGQLSVNVVKPGKTKGQHWHSSKWELFTVVHGRGLIRERRVDGDELLELEVSGDNPQEVHMLPGYTHSITNLSKTEDLVMLIWANEKFSPENSDTYYEEV